MLRYYSRNWVPTTTPAAGPGRRGNALLALLVTAAVLGALGGLSALTLGTVNGVKDGVVFIELDVNGDGRPDGSGSGAIINPKGYVLTNLHVARPQGRKPRKITVWLWSGTSRHESFEAVEEATDPDVNALNENTPDSIIHDWAVLKIINASKPLPWLRLGDSHTLQELTTVVSYGFPLGRQVAASSDDGPPISVKEGKISALTRMKDEVVSLTHSCELEKGNSGGPLCTERGEIVGLNTRIGMTVDVTPKGAQIRPAKGQNLALPIHKLDRVQREYAQK
jgi:S1-C subfamily serine protease